MAAVDGPHGNPHWHQPGRWRVAPWNYESEARGSLAPAGEAKVFVVDSTIRSIITSEAGSAATVDDFVDIARALAEAGIRETVFNIVHGGEPSALALAAARKIVEAKVPIQTSTELHVAPDNWKRLLDFGMSLGLDCVQWAYGTLPHIPGYSMSERAIDLCEEGIDLMVSRGQQAAFAYNFTYDEDPEFIVKFFQRAAKMKVQSLRLYDPTVSVSPDAMRWLVERIKAAVGPSAPPLVVHTHDTWGLASAVTIAAVLGGADGIDLVVNGLGTKGGHTSMASTLVALEALYGVRTGVKLEQMMALSNLVSERTGVPVARVAAAVGPDFFLVEQAGLVQHAYQERDDGTEYDSPYAPSLVGQRRRIVWGRNTVKEPLLAYVLKGAGLEATPERVERARVAVDRALSRSTRYPIWLSEEEVVAIVRQT